MTHVISGEYSSIVLKTNSICNMEFRKWLYQTLPKSGDLQISYFTSTVSYSTLMLRLQKAGKLVRLTWRYTILCSQTANIFNLNSAACDPVSTRRSQFSSFCHHKLAGCRPEKCQPGHVDKNDSKFHPKFVFCLDLAWSTHRQQCIVSDTERPVLNANCDTLFKLFTRKLISWCLWIPIWENNYNGHSHSLPKLWWKNVGIFKINLNITTLLQPRTSDGNKFHTNWAELEKHQAAISVCC